MSTIGSVILAGVLIAVFTALLTYFVTSLSNKGNTRKVIKEEFKTHVGMYHKTDLALMIESTKLKLEKDFKEGVKENKISIIDAHKRIDETKKDINEIAVTLASIQTGQTYIIKALDAIQKGMGHDS